ncbi:MAG: hypothetical protein D6773_06080, partial [Alphaproteobacteria bacterium]
PIGRAADPGPEHDARFQAVRAAFGFVPAQLRWTPVGAARLRSLRAGELGVNESSSQYFEDLIRTLDADQLEGRHPLNKSLYLCSKTMLPNRILTTLGDRVEMAHSIEARLPFLDHKVVEFLRGIPPDLKVRVSLRGGTEKHLLKEAARGLVTETLYRRKKHPFTAPPTRSSRRDPMSELVSDILHGSDMRNLDLYDQKKVLTLHDRSKSDGGSMSNLFLHLATLAIMQRRFGLSLA